MSSSNLIRWGGPAAILAGIMYAGQGIVGLLALQKEVFTSFSDYLIEMLFVVALVGTLVTIASLHTLQRGRYGRLGVAGSSIAFFGFALMCVIAAASIVAGHDVLEGLFAIGFLAELVGLVLLGAATLRARMLPRWCGVLLIVGLPLSAAAGESFGGIVLGIVWALVGYAFLSSKVASAQRPAPASN